MVDKKELNSLHKYLLWIGYSITHSKKDTYSKKELLSYIDCIRSLAENLLSGEIEVKDEVCD